MRKPLTKCDACGTKVDLIAAQAFNKTLAGHVVALINMSKEGKDEVVSASTLLDFLQGALKDACREADKFIIKGFKY